MGVLAVRSTMDEQQHRVLPAGHERWRFHHDAVHVGAVFTLGSEVLRRAELQFVEQRVVLVRQSSQHPVLERERLGGAGRRSHQ